MPYWDHLFAAFAAVFEFKSLVLMTVGVVAGLIAGAIPGFTITMAIVLTLPFTFGMPPVQGLSTMLGVYVGGLSGGLMSAILIGIPGTPSAVATTFDGFTMARAGKPGLALGIGVWSSFFGGLLSAILLSVLAPQLARIGLEFGPWDFFSLVAFALTIAASLSDEDLLKGLIAGVFGILVASFGEDQINGVARFTFGIDALDQGFAFLSVLVGLFAFSQLMSDLRDPTTAAEALSARGATRVKIEHVQAIKAIVKHWGVWLHSSLIGVFVGVLPAAGSSISNILAYDQVKKASKYPEKFGTGIPDGIIASESANNATAGGALITMMALGIPGDAVTAVMLGALLIHDIAPSPTFISTQPRLAYGIIVAFFLAHFIMVACQTFCLRLFVLIMRVPLYVLAAVILAYCAIGVFSLNNVDFDLWTLLIFGIIGYVMVRLGFPLTPMILGVVLGPVAEVNLSRSLATSDNLSMFVTRHWSLFFIILAVFSLIYPWFQRARGKRKWTLAYAPALAISLSLPLLLMGGWVRPIAAAALLLFGAGLIRRRWRDGWKLEAGDQEVTRLHQG
ncbi:MAG TPA: tripartite tricarboxylate transporter permease [Pseudolabrys sp.]|jgi:putative tricarboxylic transport membrane protein|nr:tripartite tricarboxylate transporter permease [Pseudolabrys sp.]